LEEEACRGWEASSEPSLLDHKHFLFTLEGSLLVCLIRNPRGTDWDFFREGVKGRLKRDPEMNMKDEGRIGLAILFVQEALISAYEHKYPLKPAMTGIHSLK
jgi:hypothetical protein